MLSLAAIEIIAAGLTIGILLGLTGGGGSILTVPLLVYVVGLDAKVAIVTSMLIVGVTSLAALLSHSRAGRVAWRTGVIFGLAGMVGAYAGGALAQHLADAFLLLLFASVMVSSGLAMLRRSCAAKSVAHAAAPAERRIQRVLADGFGVGMVTGLVGAGGGFLVVPALALLGGLPMHTAIGTSLLVIVMNCGAGIASYALTSHVPLDVDSATVISVLSIAGTLVGARLARRVSPTQLQRGFGVFVLLVAAILICIEGSGLLARVFAADRFIAGAGILCVGAISLIPPVAKMLRNGAAAQPLH
ncbi:MAG: sulfite exporter TauE/SafE family protein [Gammaproteobacteria bacterium]|nr:sulfite exporter TauE/SafE family protein [Gammaproteobacteria bacterium]